jgi:hypothetical protein
MGLKTYRATQDGFLSGESRLVKEGEVFSTTEAVSEWTEDISPKEAKADAAAKADVADETKAAKGA